MSKKIIALVLCALMLLPALASCKNRDENYVGPIINMYLNEMVYDFDPLYAFNNESALKIVSLLFEPLFKINAKGKLEKALVKDYKYEVDELNKEYTLTLKLNETNWSDGTYVSSNDLVYAWKRIMDPENSNEAAALLYDIKNARAVKNGDSSIDTLGVYSVDQLEVQIVFEQDIDINMFLYNLTSYALVPLREDIVAKNSDWAKKSATIVCSGPFIIRSTDYGMDPRIDEENINRELVLERNSYYYRDKLEDDIDVSVSPYKIKVTYESTPEEQIDLYNGGTLFFLNYIALSRRAEMQSSVTLYDSASSHSYIFNTEALIKKAGSEEGVALFADARVRQALSCAVDRNAIAAQIVYAKPATGIVPHGVFETNTPNVQYRDTAPALINGSADLAKAQSLLAEAGVNPSEYTFEVSYRSGKEVHKAIAEAVVAAWAGLGFNVTAKEIAPIVNNDEYYGEDPQQDICDDVFNETYFYRHPESEKEIRSFEVLAVDLVAQSIDAFGVLAPFAVGFTGQGIDFSALNTEESLDGDYEYDIPTHISGYNSEAYNAKIEEAFAQKDYTARYALLKEAEEILMNDMPVMPIIFNQQARLVSDELSKVKFDWLGFADFRDTMLDNFERFAETTEPEFIETVPPSDDETPVEGE
ncbi:MAG: hypothetical protein E7601_07645 [Ruminococcaceae bacterium]|nr:hypothetical protein [Oscillospiraceae bacterium]